ncbi:unnamed protein product [Mytilus coruscus]|uniref:DDE-1 domain-containing protein n=1 Tax=Mytilus coruscus TaxID=42192 RepID=A0A6J8EFL0_MYTCO|nr:unnamed protein product [Mytilus coruscus]
MQRARCASKETLSNYYKELGTIMTQNNLHDQPQKIFNIDESALQTEHNPNRIVHDIVVKPQSVTSPRSSNVTIIGAGNAIGNAVPPYYVFPGVKFDRALLLDGTPPGSDGQCSKTGWSNSDIFKTYLEKHFLKYVSHDISGTPLLILFDGHRSHVSFTLQDWAESKNIILFILPPHCSHILQPLDIGCFGPFKACYNREAQLFMRRNPGFDIGQMSCSPYQKGLSAQNLTSSFKKSGIYPFNPKAVDTTELAPATIYHKATSDEATESTMNHSHISQDDENTLNQPDQLRNVPSQELSKSATLTIQQFKVSISAPKEDDIVSDHDESNSQPLPVPFENMHPDIQIYTAEPIIELNTSNNSSNINTVNSSPSGFLLKRSVVSVEKTEKKRNHFTITGNLGKKKNMDHLNQSKKKVVFKPPFKKSEPITKKRAPFKRKSSTERVKTEKQMKLSEDDFNAGLGTSGLNKEKGGPICLDNSLSDSDLTDDDDGETCCVCNKKSPSEIRQLAEIVFVKWAQCDNDNCRHWTHLQFCSDVRVLRRGDTFFCPHCKAQ